MLKLHRLTILILAVLMLFGSLCTWADQTAAKPASTASAQEKDFFASLDTADEADSSKDGEPSVALTVISFIGKLILVLAIAYGCIYGLKKINTFKTGIIDGNKQVVVLEHTSIGPGRQLHLVNVGGKSLLLGSTSQQISILAELDPDQIAAVPQEPALGFKDQLSQFLGHNPKKEDAAKSVAEMLRESTEGLRGTVSQVNKLRGGLRNPGDE